VTGRISRFLCLSTGDRTLLLQATLLLATIRLGLYALSFARVRHLLAALARSGSRTEDEHGSEVRDRMVWAVQTASRQFPAIGTCLTQALTVHVLLARRGTQSDLRIGVRRSSAGEFIAHAWLEKDGNIVIGEADHASYSPMPVLNVLKP
jgi:hypothetical protein